MRYPSPPFLPLGLSALFSLGIPMAAAAQTPMDRVVPIRPSPVTDAAVLAEYGREIHEEYALYFDEAQAFFHCIEQARAIVTEEVNRAIVDYGALDRAPRE